jgi:hypothetical protein
MDAVITGVILSGIVASIYGVKKLREKEEKDKHDNVDMSHQEDHAYIEKQKTFLQKIFHR